MFERFRDEAAATGINMGDLAWPDDDPAWTQAAAILEDAVVQVFALGFDRANELLIAAFEDVLDEAAHHPDNTVTTGWFQFQLADVGTQLALAHRRYDRLLEWLLRPLVDAVDIPTESFLPLARVAGLADGSWTDHVSTRRTLRRFAVSWLRALFYYAHRVNHLTNEANDLTDLAFSLAMEGRVNDVPMAVALFGWLISTDPTPDQRRTQLIRLIAAAEADDQVADGQRVECALTIATTPVEYFGDPSTATSDRRALRAQLTDQLLHRWSDKLVSHQRLQFLVSQLSDRPEELDARHDDVLAAIDEYLTELADTAQRQGPHAAYYQRGRLFSLIAPLIRTALLAGKVHQATEALARWRGVPAGEQLQTPLFHLSAEPNGTHWIWPGHDCTATNPEAMVNAVLATNRFLRVHTTVANVPEVELEPLDDPSKLGDPDSRAAPAFAAASADIIRTDLITDQITQLTVTTTALVPVPGQTLPWQSHLARQQLPVWPISSSLRQPENDRPPRRIVIWDSGELWSAPLEIEALQTVAANATDTTIDIDIVTAGTAEHFTDLYRDPDIDILWLVSHGEYDHYSPHQSRIPVNLDQNVTLNELLAIQPTWNGRRLLVLNSCDGAASASYGGPTDFGFAPTLASAKQAVISHLWPVESFHVAPAFGAILMAGVIDGKPCTVAFANSVRHIVQGWDAVAAELERLGATDLADAARHTSIDLDDVTYWGTPALFV
jgi:hypothetical protein